MKIILSAVCGGITDLSFDAVGYSWQAVNCVLTASYSLVLPSSSSCESVVVLFICLQGAVDPVD
ncbi:hypothetical protein ACLOJK_012439 [Asimina triloba]